MSTQIIIRVLAFLLSLLKAIISFIEMVLHLYSSEPIPEYEFPDLFDQFEITIPNDDSDFLSDLIWHFSSASFINDINLHHYPYQCRYNGRYNQATFLYGSCYYNSFGDLTKCGYISYSHDWSHDCRGQGFQFGIDPPHIGIHVPNSVSDQSSDSSDINDFDWDEFSYSS